MEYVITIITIIFVSMIVSKIFEKIEKDEEILEKNTFPKIFTQSKSYVYAGTLLLGVLMFGAIVSIVVFPDTFTNYYYGRENLEYMIILFICATPLSMGLIIYCLNWKLEVYEEKFIYTNILRISREYYYSDVEMEDTRLLTTFRVYKIREGKKRKRIATFSITHNDLMRAYYAFIVEREKENDKLILKQLKKKKKG